MSGWTEEEEKKLVDEVKKLGGKVKGWYVILFEKNIFPGRSKASINSQYNSLLRKRSPLVDTEILDREDERRYKLKQRQIESIRRGLRPPLKQDNPELYDSWKAGAYKWKKRKRKHVSANNSIDYLINRSENVDDLNDLLDGDNEATRKLKQKNLEYKDKYRKVYWGKSKNEYWPCLSIPPVFRFDSKSIQSLVNPALDTGRVFVLWFGDYTYQNVTVNSLFPWCEENHKKFLVKANKTIVKAYLEAEMFLKGVSANGIIQSLNDLIGKNDTFVPPKPMSTMHSYDFEKQKLEKIDFKNFRTIAQSFLDKRSETLKLSLLTQLKCLYVNEKLDRSSLISQGVLHFVVRLCGDEDRTLSDLSRSLINIWKEEFKVLVDVKEEK